MASLVFSIFFGMTPGNFITADQFRVRYARSGAP
jgi:hypothetical protein